MRSILTVKKREVPSSFMHEFLVTDTICIEQTMLSRKHFLGKRRMIQSLTLYASHILKRSDVDSCLFYFVSFTTVGR